MLVSSLSPCTETDSSCCTLRSGGFRGARSACEADGGHELSCWAAVLVYLSDIFDQINTLNASLQVKECRVCLAHERSLSFIVETCFMPEWNVCGTVFLFFFVMFSGGGWLSHTWSKAWLKLKQTRNNRGLQGPCMTGFHSSTNFVFG